MVSTKQCVLILSTLVLILSGATYTNAVLQDAPQNSTVQTPTIIVSGDGSSGTGNVTNTQIVQVENKQIEQGEGIISETETDGTIVGVEKYTPDPNKVKP